MPDDCWDEEEALEILTDHCCPGVRFELDGGDLMLAATEEDSDYWY